MIHGGSDPAGLGVGASSGCGRSVHSGSQVSLRKWAAEGWSELLAKPSNPQTTRSVRLMSGLKSRELLWMRVKDKVTTKKRKEKHKKCIWKASDALTADLCVHGRVIQAFIFVLLADRTASNRVSCCCWRKTLKVPEEPSEPGTTRWFSTSLSFVCMLCLNVLPHFFKMIDPRLKQLTFPRPTGFVFRKLSLRCCLIETSRRRRAARATCRTWVRAELSWTTVHWLDVKNPQLRCNSRKKSLVSDEQDLNQVSEKCREGRREKVPEQRRGSFPKNQEWNETVSHVDSLGQRNRCFTSALLLLWSWWDNQLIQTQA